MNERKEFLPTGIRFKIINNESIPLVDGRRLDIGVDTDILEENVNSRLPKSLKGLNINVPVSFGARPLDRVLKEVKYFDEPEIVGDFISKFQGAGRNNTAGIYFNNPPLIYINSPLIDSVYNKETTEDDTRSYALARGISKTWLHETVHIIQRNDPERNKRVEFDQNAMTIFVLSPTGVGVGITAFRIIKKQSISRREFLLLAGSTLAAQMISLSPLHRFYYFNLNQTEKEAENTEHDENHISKVEGAFSLSYY